LEIQGFRYWKRGSAPATEIPVYIAENHVTFFFVMTDVVSFTRALGDTTRWRIVRLVNDEALCVCELADILDMPQSSVSSHVQVLRRAGLLESERCEKWTYFRIDARFLQLIRNLERFFEHSDSEVWEGDAAKAAARLARRAESCCPGPKTLISRNPKKPITKP
jgi:ArsR family transcriptional regulator